MHTGGESTTDKREIVHRAARFNVERCAFESRGTAHVWEIVRHPGAAAIVPVLDDGRLVLIRNRRIAVDQTLLEIPAGTLDNAEPPEQCAARELTEETGYRAGKLVPLLTCYSSPGIMDERMYCYLATGLTPGPSALESGEEIEVVQMPLAEALDGIKAGTITDGKTIVALLYYDRFVRGMEAGA